jgi:O-Antigen ligase
MASWRSTSPRPVGETEAQDGRSLSPAAATGIFVLVILGILVAWWAWKQGAYFGPVFYPGAIALFLVLALYLLIVPCPVRIDGGARIALLALTGLAAWTLISILWTPIPAAAVEYSERAFAYSAVLFLALWAARMLGGGMWAALAPIAVAGAVVGVATTIAIGTRTDVTWLLHEDGTLRFPIGYRNANAAFFLISMWALVGLVGAGRGRWAARALGLAAATVVVDLAVISQSRGSIPAFAIAFLVYLAVSPRRLRATVFAALAILPAAAAMPAMLDVYRYGKADPGIVGPLHHAAGAIAVSGAVSLVVAAIALGLIEPRLRLGPARVRALSWGTGITALVVILAGAGIYLGRHGGPVDFAEERVHQFDQVGYPDLHGQGVRFGVNVGSNRHDFWRVSADEGLAHPLLGGGAGSFQFSYLLHKRSDESPRDPHSIEALAFSELGFPGLIMVVLFVVGACMAVWRSRRRGPPGTAVLVAAGAAGATQWFVHTSYDWFWQYPVIPIAGVFMLGVACAPGLSVVEEGLPRPLRWTAALWAFLLACAAVPLFLSDAYTKQAEGKAGTDPAGAVIDYNRAADLNPLSDRALIGRGVVQARAGADALAVETLHEASGRVPDDYVPYYLLGEVLAESNPAAARAAAAKARSLNPRGPEVIVLQRQLAKARKKPPQG